MTKLKKSNKKVEKEKRKSKQKQNNKKTPKETQKTKQNGREKKREGEREKQSNPNFPNDILHVVYLFLIKISRAQTIHVTELMLSVRRHFFL